MPAAQYRASFHYEMSALLSWYKVLMTTTHEPGHEALISAQSEIRQLKETISVMRERMDEIRLNERQIVQQSVANSGEELLQLRHMVQALREQMEFQKQSCDERIQSVQAAARDEVIQLQNTIVELRGCMERSHAAGA